MSGLPPFLESYLLSVTIGPRHAAYVVLDPAGRVAEFGGDLRRYGLSGIVEGEGALDHMAFLEGMLPPGPSPIELPALEACAGRFADVHIDELPDAAGGCFVLLLDVTSKVLLHTALHQKSNDLDLLREQIERAPLLPTPEASSESTRVTVLRAHLRFRTGSGEEELTGVHLLEARRAQWLMAAEVRRNAGLSIGTSSAELCAVFGVQDSTCAAPRQAVDAARAVLAVIERSGGLVAGVGIATGDAVVSSGSDDEPADVLGPALDDSLRLSLIASSDCVLVDEATAAGAGGVTFDEWDAAGTGRGPLFVHRGVPPGHGEMSGVLSALGVAMFEVREEQLLAPTGPVPKWGDALLVWEGGASGGLRPVDELSFLANFLVDAAGFWARGEVGVLRSGNWTEVDASSGTEHAFEALALVGAGGRRLLLLDFLGEAFEERRSILQRARETSLSFESLQGDVQKKDVLLHCIVHDLKAPLSSIVGALSLLSTTELDREKTAALLEIGLRQARRQKELIRQVLEVFAAEIRDIEAVELDPKRAPDVARCGREGVENYRPVYAEKGVDLVWNPGPHAGREVRVVGAYDRLERALANLLENALRFSPEGTRTEVSLREEGLDVVLSVSDRGPGVDSEKVPHLFDRFFRGSNAGSSGLGLYYCRMTLSRWGGSVGYEAREGGGAVFWLRLVRASSGIGV